MSNTQKYNRLILLLIVLIGIILRFFNFSEAPLTQDEYSALFRLDFSSFSELIEKGVKIDGHPAGVHVFLYYWTKIFGTAPWIIKLPFVLTGIGSIYLIFLISKKWFNETVGLITAGLLATLQYTVMYSLIARPYISGMFLCLLMFYYWSKLVRESKDKFVFNGLMFVLSGSLCTYNHHFSLLFAFLLGVSGLFFIQKRHLWKYMLCGLLIFTLYIPHLSIFQYQLSQGGVENWLSKPKNDFIIDYLFYIFHFSYWFIAIVLMVILAGFFLKGEVKDKKGAIAKYILFLSLFALPFIISFFYSRYVSAVLQYSVLIFGFPFLLIFLFGHFKELKAKWNLMIVLVIMGISIFSLVYERQHYNLFYGSANRDIVVNHDKFKSDKTLSLGNIYKKTAHYNGALLNIDSTILKFEFNSPKELKSFLEEREADFDRLYYGFQVRKKPWAIPVIQSYFPNLIWHEYYQDGSAYLFEKGKSTVNYLDQYNFEEELLAGITGLIAERRANAIGGQVDKCYHHKTFVYERNIEDISLDPYKFIDVSVAIYAEGLVSTASIDCWLELDGVHAGWSSLPMEQLYDSNKYKGVWTNINHTFPLKKEYEEGELILKVRISNPDKEDFYIDDFSISIREENPYIYKLYQKI